MPAPLAAWARNQVDGKYIQRFGRVSHPPPSPLGLDAGPDGREVVEDPSHRPPVVHHLCVRACVRAYLH